MKHKNMFIYQGLLELKLLEYRQKKEYYIKIFQ